MANAAAATEASQEKASQLGLAEAALATAVTAMRATEKEEEAASANELDTVRLCEAMMQSAGERAATAKAKTVEALVRVGEANAAIAALHTPAESPGRRTTNGVSLACHGCG